MKFSYLEILPEISKKYTSQLNDKLISLKIVQSENECFLHSEYSDELKTVYIENLDVISDDDLIELSSILNSSLFNPNLSIEENARKFIDELDAETIAMCFDKIII